MKRCNRLTVETGHGQSCIPLPDKGLPRACATRHGGTLRGRPAGGVLAAEKELTESQVWTIIDVTFQRHLSITVHGHGTADCVTRAAEDRQIEKQTLPRTYYPVYSTTDERGLYA